MHSKIVVAIFLFLFTIPLAAQDPALPHVLAIVNGSQIVLFTPDATTVVADVPASPPVDVLDAQYVYQVSSDHQWIILTSYYPPVIGYGRVGEAVNVVPLDEAVSFDYRFLSASFSPNNDYLVFTLAVEYHWKLGFLELTSGKIAWFEGDFAGIEPDLSPEVPFGNMVPLATAWSSDGKMLYLETVIPFWGCRGPHDFYAINISDLDFDAAGSLPVTVEIALQGNNTYSYAFSPDRHYFAYVFQDVSCQSGGPRSIAFTDLGMLTDQVLVEADEDQFLQIIGWTQPDSLLYAQSAAQGTDDPGYPLNNPILYLWNIGQSEMVELPPLSNDDNIWATKLYANVDKLVFSLATDPDNPWNSPSILYERVLTDATSTQIASDVLDWKVCGDSVYFITGREGGGVALFSHVLTATMGEHVALYEASDIQFLWCGL